MDVTVCVGTFGDDSWITLAQERAIPSVPDGVPVIHAHRDTLHDARNAALELVSTPWVIFLDADDELTPNYIDAMSEANADVRVPLVCYVANGSACRPRALRVAGHHHECGPHCLPFGNYIVIGACVRTGLINQIGGWRDFDWSEDWDVWLRCHLAGASFAWTRAMYKAHARPDSRNRAASRETRLDAHRAIARANGVPVPA